MSIIASIGAFVPALFGHKLALKTAKVVGVIVLVLAAVAAILVGKALYDRSVIAEHESNREAAASGAREEAAERAGQDAIDNTNSEKEIQDVIQAAPGGAVSPAALALACERLRRHGRIPEACRSASGDGSQANPD